MNKQQTLDAIYGCLVELRAKHPHGLRAIASGNAHEVFTRWGVPGHAAEIAGITLEFLEEQYDGRQNPMELIELIADNFNDDGTLKEPFNYDCNGIAPGAKDSRGLFTHPDKFFTACNWNGKQFGIEADASQSPGGGLDYYQDWRDADEIKSGGSRILKCWDAKENRFLTEAEIASQFPHASHN